jgi:hypothetical protein
VNKFPEKLTIGCQHRRLAGRNVALRQHQVTGIAVWQAEMLHCGNTAPK